MTEIPFVDDEAPLDLEGMIAMAWRLLARAIRAGRSLDAKRWLSVHARLTAMEEPGAPAPAPEADAAPAPAPAARPGPRVHPMHPMHHVFQPAPSPQPETGPDPP